MAGGTGMEGMRQGMKEKARQRARRKNGRKEEARQGGGTKRRSAIRTKLKSIEGASRVT